MDPENIVRPQDRHMATLSRVEQEIWGHEIVSAVAGLFPVTRLKLTIVAGARFISPVANAVMGERYTWDMEVPFAEMSTKKRLDFFGIQNGAHRHTRN